MADGVGFEQLHNPLQNGTFVAVLKDNPTLNPAFWP
jgi:hypothetical protein